MTQFLRDQASDSEEVDTPLMLDGTYLSRNFATLGPLPDSRRVILLFEQAWRRPEHSSSTVDSLFLEAVRREITYRIRPAAD